MGACAMLPRIVGLGRASELLYTGRAHVRHAGVRVGFLQRALRARTSCCSRDGIRAHDRARPDARARDDEADAARRVGAAARRSDRRGSAGTGDAAWRATTSAARTRRSSPNARRASKATRGERAFGARVAVFRRRASRVCAGLAALAGSGADVLDDERNADASCRAWVRALADGGWLRACVPGAYRRLRAELDVRTLCLARETLAYRSALADFAFAMQGLGSAPIALFGNADLQRRYLPNVAIGRCVAGVRALRAGGGLGRRRARDARSARRRRVRHRRREDVDLQRRHRRSLRRVRAHRRRRGERPDGVRRRCGDARAVRRASGSRRSRRIRSGRCASSARASPVRCRIGEEGEGFKIAMATLDVFRSTVGAAAVGFARRALDESRGAREIAQALRRAAGGAAVDAGGDRGDGDRRRCERAARLSRGLDEGLRPRTRVTPRVGDGEVVRDRGGGPRLRSRRAAVRRPRRDARRDRRAALPRRSRAAHLRGRERDPADRHREADLGS